METRTETEKSSSRRGYCRRNRAQRAADLLFIEKAVLQGKEHAEVAADLSVLRSYRLSRQAVTKAVGQLRSRWEAAATETFATHRAKELRRLEAVGREAWSAWESSKAAATGVAEPGNPAFLGHVLGAHDRRAKLLGLLAPVRTEVSGPAGGAVRIDSAEDPAIDAKARLELLRRHCARLEEQIGAEDLAEHQPSATVETQSP